LFTFTHIVKRDQWGVQVQFRQAMIVNIIIWVYVDM